MTTADEARAEAARRYPPNHTIEDPFGATGEAQSDPYGYIEMANLAFLAGAEWQASRKVEVNTKPERLDPELRADLIEFARDRIEAVWTDVPGGVDAATLASNIVAAQEFCWMSRQVPVARKVEVTAAQVEAVVRTMEQHEQFSYVGEIPRCECGAELEDGEYGPIGSLLRHQARASLEAALGGGE